VLKDAIRAYEERRISEAEYLTKAREIMEAVLSHTDSDIPAELQHRDVAKAFYGLSLEGLGKKFQDQQVRKTVALAAALAIDDLVRKAVLDSDIPIIDWQDKSNITGRIQIEIGDYLIDEIRDKYQIELSFDELDAIADRCIEVAKIRYK
jgi:type I restriction enzyme R subunit